MWKYVTILILLTASLITYYDKQVINNFIKIFTSKDYKNELKLFTSDEIAKYNGVDKPELYLVILGNIFDVTKGAKHYGPGETYHVFIGQDASRSFVTGKFNKQDISEDVTGLSLQEIKALKHWLDFYKKEYVKIGKLIGKYYNSNGKLTPYGKEIKNLIKTVEINDLKDENEKLKFPPCNIEWDRENGTRVWCTKKSGGIDRNWVGVPRKYFEPGQTSFRCACIQENHQNLGNIEQYQDCAPDSTSCYVKQ